MSSNPLDDRGTDGENHEKVFAFCGVLRKKIKRCRNEMENSIGWSS